MEPAVLMGLVAAIMATWLVAARRIASGDGRFVWLLILPMLLADVVVIVLGVQVASNSLVAGALMIVLGVGLGAAGLRLASRMSASVSQLPPGGDLTAAMIGPLADSGLLWGLLLAGGALLAVVGLIAWGVLGR